MSFPPRPVSACWYRFWCRLLGATAQSVLEVARAAAPIVPLIGALAALLAFAAARVLVPGRRLAPLASAFVLLTIPVHHFYAQYGQVDHQVIEPLLPALVMILVLRSVASGSAHPAWWALSAGLGADLAYWIWPAAFIPLGIVHLVLLALALWRGTDVVRRALQMAAAAFLFSPILIPAMPAWRFDIWTVSLLQPLINAALLMFWLAVWWLARATARARIGVVLAALAAAAGLLALAPGTLRAGLAFVLREDPVVAFVPEAQSILSSRQLLTQYLGPHIALLPIALCALLVLALRDPGQRGRWLALLVWLAAAALLPVVQFRFVTYLPIPLAASLGILASVAWTGAHRAARSALAIALAATIVIGVERAIFCQPAGHDLDQAGRLLVERESAFHECALALRGPESRFRLARSSALPLPRPVAVELFMGHQVIALGERPVIASGFGSELESHYVNAQLFTLGEADALRLCDASQVQFFLACELPPYLRQGYEKMAAERAPLPHQSLNERLLRTMGCGDPGQRAIAAFRAVFEPEHRGWVRVFERVAGALLPVATQPHAQVMIGIKLECAHGHKLAWQDGGRADDQGHLLLRLPYATSDANGEIRAADDYQLMVANRTYKVRVSGRQVLNGETVGEEGIRPER
ncbi:MAG: hypothetical protein U1E76_03850 [Planctomycetota bacterium]